MGRSVDGLSLAAVAPAEMMGCVTSKSPESEVEWGERKTCGGQRNSIYANGYTNERLLRLLSIVRLNLLNLYPPARLIPRVVKGTSS